MSTIAPSRIAQPLFLLRIVSFTVSATPVLSDRMSAIASDEGLFVGNGPSVSVGVIGQDPLLSAVSSFLHAAMKGNTTAPIPSFFKNSFLSISVVGKQILAQPQSVQKPRSDALKRKALI